MFFQLLKTCSEPDLRQILVSSDNDSDDLSSDEDQDGNSIESDDDERVKTKMKRLSEEETYKKVVEEQVATSSTDSHGEGIEDDDDSDNRDEDLDDSDCEAEKDLQNMLKTMQDVLKEDEDDDYQLGNILKCHLLAKVSLILKVWSTCSCTISAIVEIHYS